MNERQVTVDNATFPLPTPFFVVATQNPHEHHGTFPLPESQLDRFMMRISIGYPAPENERTILALGAGGALSRHLEPRLTAASILECMDQVSQVKAAPAIDDYILALVQATRQAPRVEAGVSPRGAQNLRRAAQAYALLEGRDYVIPDDVKTLAVPVLSHRLILSSAQLTGLREESETLVASLLNQVPVPL
jgi:MoxR-like ATPase